LIERDRGVSSIIAWQVEHESVDPLGFEHSWRLDSSFVEAEVNAARQADPSRPILMNGFLPVSLPGLASQWWQTRDQGDSLDVAVHLADIVGVDFYPRVGLFSLGGTSAYLDGSHSPWQLLRLDAVLRGVQRRGKRVMLSEGQAEPWETVTVPPNPRAHAPYSCTPLGMLDNYNRVLRRARRNDVTLDAYLFWGAEYWMLRQRSGDASYLQAFARVLEQA